MLANGFLGFFLLFGMFAAASNLVLAVVLEVPILAWFWKQSARGIFRLVLIANCVSAVIDE